MRSLQAIILAAGEGTRMKSDLPKVLHPICGRPMLSYALDLAAAAGIKQPIVILGKGAEQIKPTLPKEAKPVLQVQRRGTGDAVLAAKKLLTGTGAVLILYADTPLLRRTTVQKLIEAHFKTSATCTLLTAHLADPSGYGRIIRNENGLVVRIAEEPEASAAERAIREINVGPLVCSIPALLAALALGRPSDAKHELYLTEIVAHIARQENAKIQVSRIEEISEALGINSRAELSRAIGVIRQRIIEAHLHNGVTIEDPRTTFIDHGVTIGADTVIRPGTVLETNVAIGKRCTIGPFAHLRPGVTVGEETKIGNFAELVRTKVGPRVRIGHLSYLGDAVIEEGVNIGAGAVTANYDGAQKHPTHIGKGAFIGSDTVLIAPVKIGPGATTGAGCVVTKEHHVPAKGIVAGVPARPLGATDGGKPAHELHPAALPAAKIDGHHKPTLAQRRPAPSAAARRAPAKAVRPKARVTPARKPARPARATPRVKTAKLARAQSAKRPARHPQARAKR